MAALGMETSAGDFEVVDLCFAGLPDLVEVIPTAGPSTSTNGGTAAVNGKGKAKAASKAEGGTDEDGTFPLPSYPSKPADIISSSLTDPRY